MDQESKTPRYPFPPFSSYYSSPNINLFLESFFYNSSRYSSNISSNNRTFALLIANCYDFYTYFYFFYKVRYYFLFDFLSVIYFYDSLSFS